jgi:hypothetical protein
MSQRFGLKYLLAAPLLVALLVMIGGRSSGGPVNPTRADLWVPVLSGDFTPDSTLSSECKALTEDATNRRTRCYTQAFGNIAYREGGISAMSALMAEASLEAGGVSDCHVVAHMVGAAAYHGLSGDFARGLAEGSSECESGYYHGLVAAEVASHPVSGPEELGSRTTLACRKYSEGLILVECYHGIGHVAEHIYDYETPVALRSCVAMNEIIVAAGDPEATRLQALHSCTQGVFMENMQAGGGPDQRWISSDDPIYPCEEFPEELGASCWNMVPWRVEVEPGDTLAQLTSRRWSVCAQASLESWREICNDHTTRGVITLFSVFSVDIKDRATAAMVASVCAQDPESAEFCFKSLAFQVVVSYSALDDAEAICRGATSDALLSVCGAGIGGGRYVSRLEVKRCDTLSLPVLRISCRQELENALSAN